MVWTPKDIPRLAGQVVVITGANSGIGYHSALELARYDAHVVLACRSLKRGRTAADRIRDQVPDAALDLEALDLADLGSVKAFADRFLAAHDRLDLLINNAGVMAIPRTLTKDGFEMQLGTNHFGHFALTGHLIDRLLKTEKARIVNVSSLAHTMARMRFDDLDGLKRYSKWAAYGQSKLANLLFTYQLQRRLGTRGASQISVACHPGYAATNLQAVGPTMTGSKIGKLIMQTANALLAQSAEKGSWPTLYAATSPKVAGGDFVGPRGPGHAHGAPVPHTSSLLSHRRADAEKLWKLSIERTGVDYEALSE